MIPLSNWPQVRAEALRKKRMLDQRVMALRQQQMREQQAQARYYGDNL